jgi:hypothetical protein
MILWDFTRNTLGSTHPPQYELFKSRITPGLSKYWADVHIPPADLNQGPPYVIFIGRSMPTSDMAIESAAYEAITRLRFTVPCASAREYCYFPSRAAFGAEATFRCECEESDPAQVYLIQYVMAQERFTQQLLEYLHYLAVLNPRIAIGGPPLPTQEGHVLRLLPPLPPLPPEEEECAPAPGTLPQDLVDLTFEP